MINLKTMRKISIASFIGYLFIFSLLFLLFPGGRMILYDIFFPLGGIFSLAIIYWSLKRGIAQNRKTWIYFILGNTMCLVGDLLWFYYDIVRVQLPANPYICDISYFIGIVFYFTGVIFYVRVDNIYNILRTSFDILIIMIVAATLSFEFIILPIYQDSSLTLISRLFYLAFPITDLGFLAGVFIIFFFDNPTGIRKTSGVIMAVAFAIWFISDQVHALKIVFDNYLIGGYADTLLPVGTFLIGLSSLWNDEEPYPYRTITKNNELGIGVFRRRRLQIILPYASCFVLIVIISFRYVTRDPLIVGAVVTSLLILIRQIFTMFENIKLIELVEQKNLILADSQKELERQNQELHKLNSLKEREAHTDFLTGLYNRRFIDSRLNSLLGEIKAKHQILSVLLIDIDNFKQINDQYGHVVGDRVLQQVTSCIIDNLRSLDIAGRFGGDEFIVILPDAGVDMAKAVGERLCAQILEQRFSLESDFLAITLSVGCVQWQVGDAMEDIWSVIARADKALYKAKGKGRNQVVTL